MPSTVIASYDYNPLSEVLKIRFVSGLKYNYLDVPEKVFEQFKASPSKGKFLNEVIKVNYLFEKVI